MGKRLTRVFQSLGAEAQGARAGKKTAPIRAGNGGNMRRSSHTADRQTVDEETRLANAKVEAWIKETRQHPQEVPLEASSLTRSGRVESP